MPKYYAINRPPFPGCYPAAAAESVVYSQQVQIPASERWAHGYVVSAEPLPFEEIWRFDLYPADEAEVEAYFDWRDEVGK